MDPLDEETPCHCGGAGRLFPPRRPVNWRRFWAAAALGLLVLLGVAVLVYASPCRVPPPPPRACRITLDGRPVSLEDLPAGASVHLVRDAWGRVVLVEARRGRK